MTVEVGQEVYVPDPDGNPVRATVLAHGAPGDAETVEINGKAAERDVAIVRHEDGPRKGFVAKVPYELITSESQPQPTEEKLHGDPLLDEIAKSPDQNS